MRGQGLQIAKRLRALQHGERVTSAWYFRLCRVIARNHNEDARVRTTLVVLAGRMQIAWADADGRGGARRVRDPLAHLLQRVVERRLRREPGEQAYMVARPHRTQHLRET